MSEFDPTEVLETHLCGRCGSPLKDGWCSLRCEDALMGGKSMYEFLDRLADLQMKYNLNLFKATKFSAHLNRQNIALMWITMVLAGLVGMMLALWVVG